MKPRFNWSIWAGCGLVVAGVLSYIPVFVPFPVTRDYPWANLRMFAVGGVMLARGLKQAYGRPALYRGKVAGPILTVLSVLGAGLFCYGYFVLSRQLPASTGAPRVGQKAPDFTLPDQDGKPVALSDLLTQPPTGSTKGRPAGV